MNTNQFADQRVLVTGAASGIGRRIAEAFHAEGAEVIGLDVDSLPGETPFRLLALDLRVPGQIAAVCRHLQQEWPRLDVLVNAAGVLRIAKLEATALADWQTCLDVNVTGPFLLMQQWLPLFKRQRSGAIINVASNAAHVPRSGMAAYGASKAALVSLSHCAGLELAPYGVRCNVVSPGSTDTPMLRTMCGDTQGLQRLIHGMPEESKLGIPLGKLATVDDIAAAVLFLASPSAGHITLQDLVIDGGATLAA